MIHNIIPISKLLIAEQKLWITLLIKNTIKTTYRKLEIIPSTVQYVINSISEKPPDHIKKRLIEHKQTLLKNDASYAPAVHVNKEGHSFYLKGAKIIKYV